MRNRFKSPVVWTTIAAQVVSILLALGAIDAGRSEAINGVIVAVLQLLVAFGVLNNPTNGEGF